MSVRLPSYMFCLVSSSSPVICNYTVVQLYSHTSHIHSYIHTIILSCIHNIYTISIHTWLHQSPKVLFGRVLSFQSSNCFKWLVLNNGQLEFTFKSCFERSVLNNGQIELSLSCFERSVLNNGQLEFIFYLVSGGWS